MIADAPALSFGEATAAALGRDLGAADLRRRAWAAFARLPWPSRETEAWRRTDISGLDFSRYHLRAPSDGVSARPPVSFTDTVSGEEAALLWGDEGVHRAGPAGSAGVTFAPLPEALRRWPELVRPHLGAALPPEGGKFEAFSAAFWTQGLFVHAPRGADVRVPLRGGYGASLADGRALVTRTLIVAEAGSRVTVIDDHAAPAVDGEALSVGGVEIVAGENAEVRYVNLQRHGAGVHHFLCQNARLAANARLSLLVIALGGALGKADFGSELLAEGAESRLYGLVFGDGDQRFTHHTRQEHRAPRTESDLLFKAALRDASRSVYTGLIRIEKEATRVNAYQSSKNVLLSPGARANAIPTLEILTDDVKCGHGAAVGHLEEDQRFYLMTRGFSREEAERSIVEGFFEEVLQRLPIPGLADRLRAAIDQKLGVARV